MNKSILKPRPIGSEKRFQIGFAQIRRHFPWYRHLDTKLRTEDSRVKIINSIIFIDENLPVRMLVNACSTFVESKAEVSMKLKP